MKPRKVVVTLATGFGILGASLAFANDLIVKGTTTGQGNASFMQRLGVGTSTPSTRLDVVGAEDPLISINHTGASGNAALWLKQDAIAKAYLWWNQASATLNLGTASANPALTISNAGNVSIGAYVGIGTTTPGAPLHVKSPADASSMGGIYLSPRPYSSPSLIYHFGNAGMDLYSVPTSGAPETARIRFIGGSGLAFSTNGAVERMRIGMNGNVGIGTTSPGAALDVTTSAGTWTTEGWNKTLKIGADGSHGTIRFPFNAGTQFGIGSTTDGVFRIFHSAATDGSAAASYDFNIATNGHVGIGTPTPGQRLDIAGGNARVASGYSWLTNSDARYKTNISTLDGALEKVVALRGVRYDVRDDARRAGGQGRHIGVIAQELEQQFPELVYTDERGYKSVAYDKLSAVVLEATKEQHVRIRALDGEVVALRERVRVLETRLTTVDELRGELAALRADLRAGAR